jgi:predicted phosphodiesterase
MKIKLFFALLFLPLLIFSQNIEIVNGPYIQKLSENEATIVWTTNKDAVSWIELAPAGNDSFYAKERTKFYESSHGSRIIGKLHRITVTGLAPGIEYRYRIFSKEIADYAAHRILNGNIVSTDVYGKKPLSFVTLDKTKPQISFKIVNDIHGKNDNLQAMLKDVNKENTDLVIFNGDMISSVQESQAIFTGFMDKAVQLFASEVPVFYARGNHESRGKDRTFFYDYFPTNNGKFYYTFSHGPVFFLVLDGGEDKPDSDIEYSGLSLFDQYRTEQSEWIREVINQPDFKSAKFRVVIMHIPPTGSTWHGTNDIAEKFLPLLNDANIDIMFSGHTHNYKFIRKGDESKLNFPVLINDDETYLDVSVNNQGIHIEQKDMTGKVVNKQVIK